MVNFYLEHMKLYLESGSSNKHLLRCFLDDWFAYRNKGPLLNRNGNPRWFNNPCPTKNREALLSMHFISNSAMKTISGEENFRLVKDHSIPISGLYEILKSIENPNVKKIHETLIKYYRLGVLTIEEDNVLTHLGYRSKMPKNWTQGDDPFIRYKEAKIDGTVNLIDDFSSSI